MSRTFIPLPTFTPGANTPVEIDNFLQPAKDNADLLALGCFARNLYGGGSEINGIGVGVGTGYITAYDAIEFEIDNTSNQLSGSANLVCRARICLRVVDTVSPASGIAVTPRVYNVTDLSVPTQSGAAACTATADDFSGSNQKQTITFTPANGKKKYVVQVVKSSDDDLVIACKIAWDVYIQS
jgi:hypothetical protein